MSIARDIAIHVERVGIDALPVIRRLNHTIFNEARIINQFDRRDLTMLMAFADEEPVGFKIGYGESRGIFYSAKGGVVEEWRRHGIARQMLVDMMQEARQMGYRRFAYDTFPNMHPGMTMMGLIEGFQVTAAGYNATYKDYRIRFEKDL